MSAAHEIGHALGLAHSSSSNSLMAPTYNRDASEVSLSQDDINGIQSIYGECYEQTFDHKPLVPHLTKGIIQSCKLNKYYIGYLSILQIAGDEHV